MSFCVLLAAILGGAALVSVVDERSALGARLCAGAPVGIALLGLVELPVAWLVGFGVPSVVVASLVVLAPLLLWVSPRWRPRRRRGGTSLRRAARLAGFWAVAGLASWAVFDRVLIESPAGIATGCDHNLGDLPFHLALVTGFAHGANLPPEHPELAGVRLTYPFVVDLVAAMLVKTGASLRHALLLENLALALSLVGLLHRWALHLTRRTGAALLTPILVLLSGGLGFVLYVSEGGDLLRKIAHLTHDYTITWTGELRWGNALVTLLVPQRSLLLGTPLAVVAWLLVWRGVVEQTAVRDRRRRLIAAGLVTGLLPLCHAHAFLAALGIAVCLALAFPRWSAWAGYFVAALAVAAPQLAFMVSGSAVHAGSFLGWQVGWDHGEHDIVWFWLGNTGLFLPLLAFGLVRGRPSRLVRFTAPFLLLFVVPNLVKLSPWIWDNVKFLFFWFVGSAPLVAAVVAGVGRRRGVGRAAAAALVVGLTLAGALDVWRMGSHQIANRVFDADGVAFAAAIRDATPPRALVLHLPTFDSPVYLTGRRTLVGYLGHISSQGLDAGDREEAVKAIYAGAPAADELLRRYAVDFIAVGPQEREKLVVDDAYLSRFPVATRVGAYRLLRVLR